MIHRRLGQDGRELPARSTLLARFLATACLMAMALLAWSLWNWRVPGNDQGYEPGQPIAYSHRQHAGDLKIECLYCHFGAERGRYAGVPSAGICMNCHQLVTTSFEFLQEEQRQAAAEGRKPRRIVSAELRQLYNALALDDQMRPDERLLVAPIKWLRVHRLPDFAYFDHRAHVGAAMECEDCHGQADTFERMRQVESLSMGWCVDCHRRSNAQAALAGERPRASLDCFACHR